MEPTVDVVQACIVACLTHTEHWSHLRNVSLDITAWIVFCFWEWIWALVKNTDITLTNAHKSLSSSIGGMFCDLIAGKKQRKEAGRKPSSSKGWDKMSISLLLIRAGWMRHLCPFYFFLTKSAETSFEMEIPACSHPGFLKKKRMKSTLWRARFKVKIYLETIVALH